eukprot:gene348-2410_t
MGPPAGVLCKLNTRRRSSVGDMTMFDSGHPGSPGPLRLHPAALPRPPATQGQGTSAFEKPVTRGSPTDHLHPNPGSPGHLGGFPQGAYMSRRGSNPGAVPRDLLARELCFDASGSPSPSGLSSHGSDQAGYHPLYRRGSTPHLDPLTTLTGFKMMGGDLRACAMTPPLTPMVTPMVSVAGSPLGPELSGMRYSASPENASLRSFPYTRSSPLASPAGMVTLRSGIPINLASLASSVHPGNGINPWGSISSPSSNHPPASPSLLPAEESIVHSDEPLSSLALSPTFGSPRRKLKLIFEGFSSSKDGPS